jgi:hypothetical protein
MRRLVALMMEAVWTSETSVNYTIYTALQPRTQPSLYSSRHHLEINEQQPARDRTGSGIGV